VLIFVVQEQTYVDLKELADFLSNIPQVANDLPKIGNVLGTGAVVYSHINWQVNANSINITQAISDLLSDWHERTGLQESTVFLLCNGSADSAETCVTKGLKNLGFDRVAGIDTIHIVVMNRNV
jgi:hypothetical protein